MSPFFDVLGIVDANSLHVVDGYRRGAMRVGLADVDEEELSLVVVFQVDFVERTKLVAEKVSRMAPERKDNRPPLAKAGERHATRTVGSSEREVRRLITDLGIDIRWNCDS